MKKMIATLIVLMSTQTLLAKSICDKHMPVPNVFDKEYILKYLGAPNWDDICWEDFKGEEVTACYNEAEEWSAWYDCEIRTDMTRSLQCDVYTQHSPTTPNIKSVELVIINNRISVVLNHPSISEEAFVEDGVIEYTKDKLIFNRKGVLDGDLYSFDGGKSYKGKATIRKVLPVFLECK